MNVSKEDGKLIVWDDHEDFEMVKGTREITDQSRWSTTKRAVFLQRSTGKNFRLYWTEGSTEQQDGTEMFYDNTVELEEVEEREVTIKKWVPVGELCPEK